MKLGVIQFTAASFLCIATFASAATHYVDLNSPSPTPPYLDWPTAATNIQDAVDAAVTGDLVLVTNGLYRSNGRVINESLTNAVAVTNAISLQSVHGPSLTTISPRDTSSSTRCAYLADGAFISGFTLSQGHAWKFGTNRNGGGIWFQSVNAAASNCVLLGNVANNSGGGAYQGTLIDCTFIGNGGSNGGGAAFSKLINCTMRQNTGTYGGGAASCMLTNCTLVRNIANATGGEAGAAFCIMIRSRLSDNTGGLYGGGAYKSGLLNSLVVSNYCDFGGGAAFCNLTNCTVYENAGFKGAGGTYQSTQYNCIISYNLHSLSGGQYPYPTSNYFGGLFGFCSVNPLPTNGTGNISMDAKFLDMGIGDLRLRTNSPCINSGANSFASGPTDVEGNQRISGGTVDMGAYEFQNPLSRISYAWLQQYGLTNNYPLADSADPDADGMNNWQEWLCGTVPTNSLSALRLLSPSCTGSGLSVTWQSVTNRTYALERSANLSAQPAFETVATGIAGQPGTTAFVDSTAYGPGPFYYRVRADF